MLEAEVRRKRACRGFKHESSAERLGLDSLLHISFAPHAQGNGRLSNPVPFDESVESRDPNRGKMVNRSTKIRKGNSARRLL